MFLSVPTYRIQPAAGPPENPLLTHPRDPHSAFERCVGSMEPALIADFRLDRDGRGAEAAIGPP